MGCVLDTAASGLFRSVFHGGSAVACLHVHPPWWTS